MKFTIKNLFSKCEKNDKFPWICSHLPKRILNPFHATGLFWYPLKTPFLYPLKTSENQRFSDVCRGNRKDMFKVYRKWPVAWNGLVKESIFVLYNWQIWIRILWTYLSADTLHIYIYIYYIIYIYNVYKYTVYIYTLR